MDCASDAGLSDADTISAHDLALAAEALAGMLPDGLCLTANGAVCHGGSGSACVDVFSQVNPGITMLELHDLLEAAWNLDPTTTLRLIFQAGNCRKDGGGKLDRRNFIRGLLWMWNNGHRGAVLASLEEIPRQGCYKDLLTLVQDAIFSPGCTEANHAAIAERAGRKAGRKNVGKLAKAVKREASRSAVKREFAASLGVPLAGVWIADPGSLLGGLDTSQLSGTMSAARRKHCYRPNAGRWVDEATRDRFRVFCRERELGIAESNRAERAMRRAAVLERRLAMDADEAELYSRVADIFARGIAREFGRATGPAAWHPPMYPWMPEAPASPACKWAPTPGNMHDRETMMSDAIAEHPLVAGIIASGAAGRGPPTHVLARMLSAVRHRSGVPESCVGRGAWRHVNYRVMPSLCRQLHGERVFCRRDAFRYNRFLADCAEALRTGDARGPKVHAGCVLPHHVVASAVAAADAGTPGIKEELQWADIVSRTKAARDSRRVLCGREGHIVPVCDVSGSMQGEPMDVAAALSLLLAESARRGSPEFGRMLTFNDKPKVVEIGGIPDYDTGEGVEAGGLAARVKQVLGMEWGQSTNFEATMDLVLDMCIRSGVSDEQAGGIVLLVLSDMEFDECREPGAAPWETTHEAISRRWRDAGYGGPPKIVYWNLRSEKKGSPVMSTQPGAACVSGFSPSILEAIMDGALCDEGCFTPEAIMALALERPCYLRLAVEA